MWYNKENEIGVSRTLIDRRRTMLTRAKKFLFLSRAKDTSNKNVSAFLEETKSSACLLPYDDKAIHNAEHLPEMKADTMPLTALLGYGNTIHAIVGSINRAAIEGKPITEQLVKEIFDKVFDLPLRFPHSGSVAEKHREGRKRLHRTVRSTLRGKGYRT